MGEGHWSPTAAPGGEFYGVRGKGAWFRRENEQAFWMTDGPHEVWNDNGAESGALGFPTSNWDAHTGSQRFEGGMIAWNGRSFQVILDDESHHPKVTHPLEIGPVPVPVPE